MCFGLCVCGLVGVSVQQVCVCARNVCVSVCLCRNQLESMNEYHKACEIQKKMYERLRRKRDTVMSIIPPLKDQHSMV